MNYLRFFFDNKKNIDNENRYWHRSLNVKKLLAVKFSHLGRNMTLQRMQKLYRLPEVIIFIFIKKIIFNYFIK